MLSGLAVKCYQLCGRAAGILATTLSHDKPRCRYKGAQEAGRVSPLAPMLIDQLLDIPLYGVANLSVSKE